MKTVVFRGAKLVGIKSYRIEGTDGMVAKFNEFELTRGMRPSLVISFNRGPDRKFSGKDIAALKAKIDEALGKV